MASTLSDGGGAAPFGAGKIVGDSFSILFGNLVPVLVVGFVPVLAVLIPMGLIVGWGFILGVPPEPGMMPAFSAWPFLVVTVMSMLIYGLVMALMVQIAYDAKLGRLRSLAEYFGPALSSVVPIAVLAIVVGIMAGIGFVLLVVPGLWVYAVFSAVIPAIVIERAGFGALGRSAELTKGYRWPIVGTVLLIGICALVINLVAGFVIGLIVGSASNVVSVAIGLILNAALTAIAYGLSGISVALIYARLREIKEGVSVEEIVSVFD
jgi:hypothetical protein